MNHTRQDERGSALGPTVDDLSDDMLLAGLGVDQKKVTKMTITNPARALAFESR